MKRGTMQESTMKRVTTKGGTMNKSTLKGDIINVGEVHETKTVKHRITW